MKSCSVLSLSTVLCWSHLSVLLGHSVLESSYSQKDSKVIGKAVFSVEDPALSPQFICHFFVLAVNRSQATLSDCNPCLHSDGCRPSTRQTWLKGRPWSSGLLPPALPSAPSSLPASSKGSCVSAAISSFLFSSHLLPGLFPCYSRLVPCHKLPVFLSFLEAVKTFNTTPITLVWFFTELFSLTLANAAIAQPSLPQELLLSRLPPSAHASWLIPLISQIT